MQMREIAGPYRINEVVGRLAGSIDADCAGRPVVLIGVLKGAFIFLSDLARRMDTPVEVDFIRAASYGDACVSSGSVRITKDVETPLGGRDVIIVEDIVDSGFTLEAIVAHIMAKGPASLKVCALIDKPSGRKVMCSMDYVGMEVGDEFIVGYGLDHAERYRNLSGLYAIEQDMPEAT